MFDRETEIKNWRRRTESTWTGDNSALDELEDHLREEIAALTRAGRSEQDAWTAAVAKLGDPAVLRREFAKIDRLAMLDRCALGAMLGVAGIIVAVSLIILGLRARQILAQPVLIIHIVTITLGYSAGLFVAAVAAYGAVRCLFARKPMPALTDVTLSIVRKTAIVAVALTILGFTFGAIWAEGALGQWFTTDPREIGAIVVALSLTAAAIAARQSETSAHIALAISIAAVAAVVAAWFGANAYLAGYPFLLTATTIVGIAITLSLAAIALRVQPNIASR